MDNRKEGKEGGKKKERRKNIMAGYRELQSFKFDLILALALFKRIQTSIKQKTKNRNTPPHSKWLIKTEINVP